MRHVVLDEADLLLTGGYEKDTQRILQSFLEGDRQQRASAAASKFGLTDDMLQRMPRQLRKAAQTGEPCWHICVSITMHACTWKCMRR
jgi:superfamily II DNA/RNA helicase